MPIVEVCRQLLDSAPEAMVVLDGTLRIAYANARTQELFGHSGAALEGMDFTLLLGSDSRRACREQLVGIIDSPGGSMKGDDFWGLRQDGAEFGLEISFGAGRIGSEPVLTGVLREVAEAAPAKHRAQMQASENRIRMEALLEAAPALIMAFDRDGAIDYINRVLPQYSKSDVIGTHWSNYIMVEHQGDMRGAIERMAATGQTQSYETMITGPDGGAIWYSSDIGPLHRDGKPVGAVLVSQDITERKRSQAELLAARRMAVLGTLAAGVAHEINTPIQFVGDSVRFLRDSGSDLFQLIEKFQELRRSVQTGMPVAEAVAAAYQAEEDTDLPYLRENMPAALDRCVDGLNRVATIVRSLKEFAHPSGREMAPVDLNHAIRSTLTIAGGEYKYVADLETDLQEMPPVFCYGSEISQVILNLVVNAAHAIADVVKGTARRGLITVRSYQQDKDAVITVHDTGGGIPEAIRGRVFDPFFTTKEVGRGTGQGLPMALATIGVQHGGSLTFETTVGEGTTFFVRIPIAGKAGPNPPT